MLALLLIIFVLSGFAGLTYELTWTKHLMLIFGVSHQAISTVLAAFMAGLALGSFLLGPLADRVSRPLRLYAVLEAGIGLSAAFLPAALTFANEAYISLARSTPQHSWAFAALRFALCFAVLLVPTTLMGGTLPALSRHFIRRADGIGAGAGLLYGANTVGGVLGAAATGFFLLSTLGANGTTRLAVATNFAVAAGAFLLSFASRSAPPQPAAHIPVSQTTQANAPNFMSAFLLIAFGLAGAASLAYEVLWTRVLIYFMDLTIYSFTTILVTFLTGLALGSFLFARIADRRRDLLGLFGLIEIAIALSAIYLLHTLGPVLFAIRPNAVRLLQGEYSTYVGTYFATAAIFMLLPTILMGGAFPVVTRLYTRDFRRLGHSIGYLYGANTIGCVAGSVVAGFLILPLAGAQQGVAIVAVVSGLLGLTCIFLSPMRRLVWVPAATLALLVAGVVFAWRVPPAVMFSPRVAFGGHKLVFYREGPEASLAVLQTNLGSRQINLNGISTAYSDYSDIVSHKLLAHPPVLMVKDPRKALVIGLGMGSTAWSLAQYPLERIDCVELVPTETESARFFLPENGGVLSDPRFHLIIGDGRNYLMTTTERYDIISFNAIHPAFSPYLYTQEFYELCRLRLTDKGIICAWIPTNSEYFPSLLRTFQEVFPHCSLWVANIGHLSLIGTLGRQEIDLADWIDRTADRGIKENLGEVHLDDTTALITRCLMTEEAIRGFWEQREARLNTDNLPYVEFDTTVDEKAAAVATSRQLVAEVESPWPLVRVDGMQLDEINAAHNRIERYAEGYRLSMAAAIESASGRVSEALRLLAEAIAMAPENDQLRYMRAAILADRGTDRLAVHRHPNFDRIRLEEIEAVIAAHENPGDDEPRVPERYLKRLRLGAARLHLRFGDISRAEQHLLKMAQSEAEVPLAEEMLATLPDPDRAIP